MIASHLQGLFKPQARGRRERNLYAQQISVVSYTYAAKGAHKVEAIKNQEANP